jgi:hypothetical protein
MRSLHERISPVAQGFSVGLLSGALMASTGYAAALGVPREAQAIERLFESPDNTGNNLPPSLRNAAAAAIRYYNQADQAGSGIDITSREINGVTRAELTAQAQNGNSSFVSIMFKGKHPTEQNITSVGGQISDPGHDNGPSFMFYQVPKTNSWATSVDYMNRDPQSNSSHWTGTVDIVSVSGRQACYQTIDVHAKPNNIPGCEVSYFGEQAEGIQHALAVQSTAMLHLAASAIIPKFSEPQAQPQI